MSAICLNGALRIKNHDKILLMVLIELTMGFVLLAPFLINGGTTVKAQIVTVPMPENGTKLILNM